MLDIFFLFDLYLRLILIFNPFVATIIIPFIINLGC